MFALAGWATPLLCEHDGTHSEVCNRASVWGNDQTGQCFIVNYLYHSWKPVGKSCLLAQVHPRTFPIVYLVRIDHRTFVSAQFYLCIILEDFGGREHDVKSWSTANTALVIEDKTNNYAARVSRVDEVWDGWVHRLPLLMQILGSDVSWNSIQMCLNIKIFSYIN